MWLSSGNPFSQSSRVLCAKRSNQLNILPFFSPAGVRIQATNLLERVGVAAFKRGRSS